MKFNKKILIPALALAAFTAVGVGSTYAIFTSEANANIAVTSGKVAIEATVENVKLYSGVYNETTAAYDSVEQTGTFLNGGTATVVDGVVTLDKITPMDKVEFDVKVTNKSTVKAKYRTSINPLDDTGLMDGLNITFDGTAYNGMLQYGEWTMVNPEVEEISTMHVVIELPEEAGNEFQDKMCSIEFGVAAVQGNAFVEEVSQDEVLITSAATLNKFAKDVNSGNTYAGKTVKLLNNIDLASYTWAPIGNVTAYPGITFAGTFDGNGYTISNMTTNDSTVNHATAGLFGSITGTVKNVTLVNPTVTSTHYAGAVVGYIGQGGATVDNCKVIGGSVTTIPELIGDEYDNGDKAGGIVGYTSNTTVTNCTVEGTTVTAHRDLGGIVGYASGTISGNTVKDATIVQSNKNAYKTNVTTFGEIVGREGSYTEENNTATNVTIVSGVYAISSAKELRDFSKDTENGYGKTDYKNGDTVVLTNDIDLGNEEFTPIGGNMFVSTFDGMGHTISNLKVTKAKRAALIGQLNGTVQNLNIDGATIAGSDYLGAIAGTAYGTIKNCTVKNVTVTATPELAGGIYDGGAKAGAVVGYFTAQSYANLLDCYAENVTVNAYRDLGGLVGYAQGAAVVTGNTIKNVTLNYVTLPAGASYDSGTPNQNKGRFYGRYDAAITANNNTDLDA